MTEQTNTGAGAVAENKHSAVERILLQVLAAHAAQAIDAPSEIDGLDSDKNTRLWR